MITTTKVLVVAFTVLVLVAEGWTLGTLLGPWGVIPATVIGWLAAWYVTPQILRGEDRV